jgi:hypothetical protein
METQEHIRAWLNNHKDALNFRGIEQALHMPRTTLQKFVKGERNLPKKWEIPLVIYLRNLSQLRIPFPE